MILKSYPDIKLVDDTWFNLSAFLSLTSKDVVNISNTGNNGCYLYVNDTPPTQDSEGRLLTQVSGSSQEEGVAAGAETIWVKGEGSKLNVNIVLTEGIPVEGVPLYKNISPPLNVSFLKDRVTTTLATDTVIGDYTVTLTTGHGILVGDILELANDTDFIFFQGKVLGVIGDIVTLDQPMPSIFTTSNTFVLGSSDDLLVDGSTVPQIYSVIPLPSQKGIITRIIVEIRGTGFMDFETFGSASTLLRGCQLRKKLPDGSYKNLINFKNNGEYIRQGFDYDFQQNTGNNVRAFTGRVTWGGDSKQGTFISLDGRVGEELQLLVQDDLTGNDNTVFIVQAQGFEG